MLDAPRSYDTDPAARQALRQAIVQRVRQDRSARVLGDGEHNAVDATHTLGVALSEALTDADGKSTRLMAVHLQPTSAGSEFSVSVPVADTGNLAVAAAAGFADAYEQLGRLRRLQVASDETLLAALNSNERFVREFAIELGGERHLKAAVDPLCRGMQTDSDRALVLKRVGALVAIGDPHAVDALIDFSQQKDASLVLQVAFAVGALGGRTAEAYLVTLAGGHPEEQVRRGAADALSGMQHRANGKHRRNSPP